MSSAISQLFQRQLKEEVDKKDATINILPSPREHVYIRNCVNCKLTVAGPPMKCTIESCRSITVEFQEKIASGILEVITSRGVTITTAIGTKVPTITIDRSIKVHLNLHEPTTVGIIHTVGVEDVFVHFDTPHMLEQQVNHPPNEDGEFMTRINEGKLLTEKCIREGGGYLTTVREKEAADKKLALMEAKMTEVMTGMIKGHVKPPTTTPPTGKPVDSKEQPAPPTKSED